MKDKKSRSFSIRLPADMLEKIEAIAVADGMNRTEVITEAVEFYLVQSGIRTPDLETETDLSKVVALLEEISGKMSHTTSYNTISLRTTHKRSPDRSRSLGILHAHSRHNSHGETIDAAKQKPPSTIKPETHRLPRSNQVAVDPQADELIIRMTEEGATLPDISSSLNESGYVSATGQAWTQSRVRDYRQKLRDRGLIR